MLFRVLRAKFEQNLALREQLLATGDALIIEAALWDVYWGAGVHLADRKRLSDRPAWSGENNLGYSLSLLRDLIRTDKFY